MKPKVLMLLAICRICFLLCRRGLVGFGLFSRAAAGYSPDRVDALVWATSELLVEPMKGEGIYQLYHQQANAAAQRCEPQPAQTVPQPGSMEWFEAEKKKG